MKFEQARKNKTNLLLTGGVKTILRIVSNSKQNKDVHRLVETVNGSCARNACKFGDDRTVC